MTITNILTDVAIVNRLLWQRVLTGQDITVPCHFVCDISRDYLTLDSAIGEANEKLMQNVYAGLNDAQTITAKICSGGKIIKVIGNILYEGNHKINPYCPRKVKIVLECDH